MKKMIMILLTLTLVLSMAVTSYAATTVNVTLADFPITLNQHRIEYERLSRYDSIPTYNRELKYPFLLYKNITYVPLTYYKTNMLNLETVWTKDTGLIIKKADHNEAKLFKREDGQYPLNNKNQKATVVKDKVTVNGKVIDNSKEQYPLLNFRNVTYFPLTWRFAVDEFGWEYSFDNEKGLIIQSDNIYYTDNKGSNIKPDGSVSVVPNETYYGKDGIEIYMTNSISMTGPEGNNLTIINNGKEIKPQGMFGYFQEENPLFTVAGEYINTVINGDLGGFARTPCKININTGEIIRE